VSRREKNRDQLQARLGYRFSDPGLLERALTHSSAISPGKRIEQDYQRLEFLGDRVLGLVAADLLFKSYPKASEGDLNRSFVRLVRGETCAAIARDLALGPELNLGDSEARSGGAEKDAILSDAAEAVFAAIYLDGGLEAAHRIIEKLLIVHLEAVPRLKSDAKTTLQEWAQARGLEPPDYVLVERTGPDHAPEFTIAVELPGFERIEATGPSKKIAEHKAAERFLLDNKVWKEPR
jgi:ribonuclease III